MSNDPQDPADRRTSDLNLLFGVLAVQLDFIGRDALLSAMNAWVLDKRRAIGDILVELGALSKERHTLLVALVAEHLQTHDSSPEQSLAAIPAAREVRELLEPVAEADPHGSLARAVSEPAPGGMHFFPTQTMQIGAPSVSRFRILRPHAKGGLGEVFVALDGELQREVALKQIQDRHADDVASRQRFLSEAEITGSLEHPSIVPVYGMGQYPNGRPFYAMRFIRGESLKEAIDRYHAAAAKSTSTQRALALRQLLGRFIDVCNALEYSHSRNVIHRDIKPSNVMLGKYGETFVVDWGLAKPVERVESTPSEEAPLSRSASASAATQMGTQVGTPQFMSPEQAGGQVHRIGFASDIYCLGATFYYLLSGAPPISDPDVLVVLKKVQSGDFLPPRERNPKVPAPLNSICLRAMSLDPAQRHPSAKAFAHEIECWLADEPVPSHRETALERAYRWTRRHRSWTQAAMGSTVLVAIIATIAGFMINHARENELAARKVAEKERTAAEENFQKARSTVDEFFTRVSESRLLNVPGLQPLRRDLLRDALAYYQGFVAQRGDDPKLKAELAATQFRIGLITNEIGAKPDALAALNSALATQRELLKHSGDVSSRVAIGNTLNALGETVLSMGQYREALEYFRQSKEQREEAARDDAKAPQLRRKVLNSFDNIAIAQALLGAHRDAVLSYEQANMARSRLMVDFPDDLMYRHDLARGYFNLAQLHMELDDLEQSLKVFRQAAELYRQLVERQPASLDFAREFAVVERLIGDVEARRNNLPEAGAAYAESREVSERLARKNPLVAELKHDLSRLYLSLAQWHQDRSEAEASLRYCDQAIVLLATLLADDPGVTQYSLDLAAAHQHRGQLSENNADYAQASAAFAEAVRVNEQLLAGTPSDLNRQIRLAKARVQLGVAQGRSERKEGSRQELQTAIDALEALRKEHPQHPSIDADLADALARRAELLFDWGQLDEAASELRRIVELRAARGKAGDAAVDDLLAWSDAVFGVALVYAEQGKSNEAITAVEESTGIVESASRRFPSDPQASASLTMHCVKRIGIERLVKRFDQVPPLAEKVLGAAEKQTLVDLVRELALTLQAMGDEENAAKVAQRIGELAVEAATKAMQLSPELRRMLREDPDFEPLQNVPAWQSLLEKEP